MIQGTKGISRSSSVTFCSIPIKSFKIKALNHKHWTITELVHSKALILEDGLKMLEGEHKAMKL